MDISWIDRSRDGWIEGWMDRGSIDRGMDRSRGSRFQDIQDDGYRRHVEHRESIRSKGSAHTHYGPCVQEHRGGVRRVVECVMLVVMDGLRM